VGEAFLIIAKLIETHFWTLYLTLNFWILLVVTFAIACVGAVSNYIQKGERKT